MQMTEEQFKAFESFLTTHAMKIYAGPKEKAKDDVTKLVVELLEVAHEASTERFKQAFVLNHKPKADVG